MFKDGFLLNFGKIAEVNLHFHQKRLDLINTLEMVAKNANSNVNHWELFCEELVFDEQAYQKHPCYQGDQTVDRDTYANVFLEGEWHGTNL